AAPAHRAPVVVGAAVAAAVGTHVLSLRHRLQMRGVDAPSVQAAWSAAARCGVMADVVKNETGRNHAVGLRVGEAVRRGVHPASVSVDGYRALPQPTRVGVTPAGVYE